MNKKQYENAQGRANRVEANILFEEAKAKKRQGEFVEKNRSLVERIIELAGKGFRDREIAIATGLKSSYLLNFKRKLRLLGVLIPSYPGKSGPRVGLSFISSREYLLEEEKKIDEGASAFSPAYPPFNPSKD